MTFLSTEKCKQEKVPPSKTFYIINLFLAAKLLKISLFNIHLHEILRLLLPIMHQNEKSFTQFKCVLVHKQIWIIKYNIIKICLEG